MRSSICRGGRIWGIAKFAPEIAFAFYTGLYTAASGDSDRHQIRYPKALPVKIPIKRHPVFSQQTDRQPLTLNTRVWRAASACDGNR